MALILGPWPSKLEQGQFQDLSQNTNKVNRIDSISELVMRVDCLLPFLSPKATHSAVSIMVFLSIRIAKLVIKQVAHIPSQHFSTSRTSQRTGTKQSDNTLFLKKYFELCELPIHSLTMTNVNMSAPSSVSDEDLGSLSSSESLGFCATQTQSQATKLTVKLRD